MDKQIIIDGIEVKDCIAYAKSQTIYLGNTLYSQAENICMVKNQPCKFFDCQFKQMARQLKAKEQECEELKEEAIKRSKELIRIRKERQEGQKMNRNLHKQLDQLKADNDELKKLLKDGGLHNLSLMAEKRVLLQTLAEIKELIQSDYCTEIGSCEFCAEIGDCLNRKILQKISEVEDGQ